MVQLSAEESYRVCRSAGFTPGRPATTSAIALGATGGETDSRDGLQNSWGHWRINPPPPPARDSDLTCRRPNGVGEHRLVHAVESGGELVLLLGVGDGGGGVVEYVADLVVEGCDHCCRIVGGAGVVGSGVSGGL